MGQSIILIMAHRVFPVTDFADQIRVISPKSEVPNPTIIVGQKFYPPRVSCRLLGFYL